MTEYNLRVRVEAPEGSDPAATLTNYLTDYGTSYVAGIRIVSIVTLGPRVDAEHDDPEPPTGGDTVTLNDFHSVLTEIRDLLTSKL